MPAPLEEDIKNDVIAMIVAGEKPADIVRATGVSFATVTRYKQSLPQEVWDKLSEEKYLRLQDKITDHLESSLDAMSGILQQFDDESWRSTQDAQGLATAYGIIADKSVRIIEGIEAANLHRENELRRKELAGGEST